MTGPIRASLLAAAALALVPAAVAAQEAGDSARVIDEGMNRSQVQLTAHDLLDKIGPRLTNSPNMRVAEGWAVDKMGEIGLANVHK
ncbi:MAG: peptidase M28, partial [Sphingomonadales bacterium]